MLLIRQFMLIRKVKMNFRAIKQKLLEKVKKTDKRMIIASAVIIVAALSALLLVFQKGTDSGQDGLEVKDMPCAMVLPHFSGFDMTDFDIVVKLSWTDGAARLENGRANLKIEARVYPINLEDKTIKWESSNPDIVSVDENGNITATDAGEVKIKAVLASEGKSAEAVLTVVRPVTGLFLPTTNIRLYTNDAGHLLTATVFPENATNQKIAWSSDNEDAATVDENGRVKPVKPGTAVITAKTYDGGYERICHVTVSKPSVEVTEVTLQNKENNRVTEGKNLQLTAVPKPTNAKNAAPLIWQSSDESVAKVGQSGRVKGIKAGKATITVSSTNGKTDNIEITVFPSNEKDALDLNNISPAKSDGINYKTYDMTIEQMTKIQMRLKSAPKLNGNGGVRDASEEEVMEYTDPSQFYTGAYKYQFLDLSVPNGISEETLNNFLADKGILRGQGRAFIDAANEFGLSEVYLIAHACLETGNGTSRLAQGTQYNGETVYNVFGIGAYDSSAVASGSQRAYEQGWTSVRSAIRGGAEWISEHYINSADGAQNTLYKMLWNPDNPTEHHYATDISWAVKQAATMERMFNKFPDTPLSYEVPVYSGMTAPVLE